MLSASLNKTFPSFLLTDPWHNICIIKRLFLNKKDFLDELTLQIARLAHTHNQEWFYQKRNCAKTTLTYYAWYGLYCPNKGQQTVDIRSAIAWRSLLKNFEGFPILTAPGILSWWTSVVCAGQVIMERPWSSSRYCEWSLLVDKLLG